jgi:DNA (cytosine-5)-methyltransferase 1
MNYYNDNNKNAVRWLEWLIRHDMIPDGRVDSRSIKDVRPEDLKGYSQCHFFAGIGGFPLAARWAGIEGLHGVWTGSCPCQPISGAGKRRGHEDERHLWPDFHRLIEVCRPSVVFGENVASPDGRDWLSAVRLDMEDLGYAFGSSDLCAAGIGSPHKRQRLYWVADSEGAGGRQGQGMGERDSQAPGGSSPVVCAEPWPDGRGSGSTLGVPDVLPQVDGIPGGMALLHGYGNAVIPGLAEMVMRSWREFRKQEGTLWEE